MAVPSPPLVCACFFPCEHSVVILFRSREFLWQEGHTAFATKEEADEEVEVHTFAQFWYGSVVNYYYCGGFGESIAEYNTNYWVGFPRIKLWIFEDIYSLKRNWPNVVY
jgi:hypothetical protein